MKSKYYNYYLTLILLVLISCNSSKKETTFTPQKKKFNLIFDANLGDTLVGKSIRLIPIKNPSAKKAYLFLKTKGFISSDSETIFIQNESAYEEVGININGYSIVTKKNQLRLKTFEGDNIVIGYLKSNDLVLKNKQTVDLINIHRGNKRIFFNTKSPHLIPLLPEKKNPLKIDFLLLNTNMKKNNFKIKISINQDTFVTNQWQSYEIKGDLKKKFNFRIQLIDQKGNLVEGPFNDSGIKVIKLD